MWERSGSVVDCLTYRGHCIVVLELDTFILALVQPRKTHPCLTERLLMGCKKSNQTIKIYIQTKADLSEFSPELARTHHHTQTHHTHPIALKFIAIPNKHDSKT